MFTKEMLKHQMEAMQIPQNSVIHVHTSLKAVGEVDGGGETVLQALIEYVTGKGGLLTVPTHTWANLHKNVPYTLDMTSAETCIGTLPSLAVAHPDGFRSAHPTHSMVAFGNGAEAFVKGEERFETPTDPDGCYGKIYQSGGYILLLGVKHSSNTFLHCVDEMLNIPNRLETEPRTVKTKYPDGSVRTSVQYTHQGHTSAYYPKYEPAFRAHGCIRDGKIGNADVQLCDARKMTVVARVIRHRSNGAELFQDHDPLDPKLYE